MESPWALKAQGIQQQFSIQYIQQLLTGFYYVLIGEAIIPISVDLLTRIFHICFTYRPTSSKITPIDVANGISEDFEAIADSVTVLSSV